MLRYRSTARWGASALLALAGLAAPPAALADDTDVYRTLPPGSKLLTILSLDLNGDPNAVVCNNVLVDPNAAGSTIPPEMVPACSTLRTTTTVENFLAMLQPYLSAEQLKVLAGALQGQLEQRLDSLSGATLGYLQSTLTTLGISLPPSVTVNAVTGAVTTTTRNLSSLTQSQVLIGVAGELARGLVGGKLALMINHANVGRTTTVKGVTYACDFKDIVNGTSIDPSASRRRRDTTACSNGAFFLRGFLDLGDVTSTTTASVLDSTSTPGKITAAVGAAVAAVAGLNPTKLDTSTPPPDAVTNAQAPTLPPYQGREVYAEVAHYLAGLETFNAALGTYDFAYSKTIPGTPATLLAPAQPATSVVVGTQLPRDKDIENASGTYISPLVNTPSCDINLVHVQTTNSQFDADSDPDLGTTYDNPDLDGDGKLGFVELSQAAAQRGFYYNNSRYKIRSYFLIQQTLADALALNVGNNAVFPFTDLVGLLGSTRAIAKRLNPTLVVPASMNGLARPNRADIYDTFGTTETATTPVYESLFQAAPDQRPNWLGNVKRLELKFDKATGQFSVKDRLMADAYDTASGRLRPGISTGFGSDKDGSTVDRGGAGAMIPGYTDPMYDKLGQRTTPRGNPGRVNGGAGRRLFTDQEVATITTTTVATVTTTVKVPVSLQMVELNVSDNVIKNDELNLDRVADEIEAKSTCALGTPQYNAQRRQQALDAVLYARGFEIGTATKPVECTATDLTPNKYTDAGARDWLMGAVLHSRPVALNYGTPAKPKYMVLFGSADGFLRMIDGSTGVEQWAFMPAAALAQQPALRAGASPTPLPYGLDGPVSVVFNDRGANGIDNDDSVVAYFGLRRSGTNYYALDITNPIKPQLLWRIGSDGLYRFLPAGKSAGAETIARGSYNPSAPVALASASATNPAAAYGRLGLAFSPPSVGRVRLCAAAGAAGAACKLEDNPRTVLLLGGGYNGRLPPSGGGTVAMPNVGKDLNNSTNTQAVTATSDPRVGSNDAVGNAVYVVDAASGDLLWRAEATALATKAGTYDANQALYSHPMLQDSIVAPVNAIDNTGDGLTDRSYFGDTGGRIWRLDLTSAERGDWTLSPIASLGRQATANSFADDRRITAGLDYVPTRVGGVAYDAVIIGTGDREDPRNIVTQNYLYALFDPDTTNGRRLGDTSYNGVVVDESDPRLFKQSRFDLPTCISGGACDLKLPQSINDTSPQRLGGWKLALPERGQKVLSQPVTTNGTILLGSYVPGQAGTNACIPSEGYSAAGAYFLGSGRSDTATLLILRDSSSAAGGAGDNVMLAGGFASTMTPVTASNLLAPGRNASILLKGRQNYVTSWRERRGDEP